MVGEISSSDEANISLNWAVPSVPSVPSAQCAQCPVPSGHTALCSLVHLRCTAAVYWCNTWGGGWIHYSTLYCIRLLDNCAWTGKQEIAPTSNVIFPDSRVLRLKSGKANEVFTILSLLDLKLSNWWQKCFRGPLLCFAVN